MNYMILNNIRDSLKIRIYKYLHEMIHLKPQVYASGRVDSMALILKESIIINNKILFKVLGNIFLIHLEARSMN